MTSRDDASSVAFNNVLHIPFKCPFPCSLDNDASSTGIRMEIDHGSRRLTAIRETSSLDALSDLSLSQCNKLCSRYSLSPFWLSFARPLCRPTSGVSCVGIEFAALFSSLSCTSRSVGRSSAQKLKTWVFCICAQGRSGAATVGKKPVQTRGDLTTH